MNKLRVHFRAMRDGHIVFYCKGKGSPKKILVKKTDLPGLHAVCKALELPFERISSLLSSALSCTLRKYRIVTAEVNCHRITPNLLLSNNKGNNTQEASC